MIPSNLNDVSITLASCSFKRVALLRTRRIALWPTIYFVSRILVRSLLVAKHFALVRRQAARRFVFGWGEQNCFARRVCLNKFALCNAQLIRGSLVRVVLVCHGFTFESSERSTWLARAGARFMYVLSVANDCVLPSLRAIEQHMAFRVF